MTRRIAIAMGSGKGAIRAVWRLVCWGLLLWNHAVWSAFGAQAEVSEAWRAELLRLRLEPTAASARSAWEKLCQEWPVPCDWVLQDGGTGFLAEFRGERAAALVGRMVAKVRAELAESAPGAAGPLPALDQAGSLEEGLAQYVPLCERRRAGRLDRLRARAARVVYTEHFNLGGSHYAYTEAQTDAQNERNFEPGASLRLLEIGRSGVNTRELLGTLEGVIRDPDVSPDGQRILFAWKKSDLGDDYHLYEMDAATGTIRQLTFGLGFADYEGQYLPDGQILFNSTRCVQTVDCWWTEVSNLYRCDAHGRGIRRLTYDQVHDNYPTVTEDGRVLYTRWEYQDRGQIFVQALFQMNPDGTGQAEFYGNSSWFPTSILHARGIPGSPQVLAIVSGHHCRQMGKLARIDPARGRQENTGVELLAPVRPTDAPRVDAYGQDGELFQYPYPLSDRECLVAYAPAGWKGAPRFALYYMRFDGGREWLAGNPRQSCSQPVPLAARRAAARPSLVAEHTPWGQVYVEDVYAGPGLAGVARGTIRKLRVTALEYRAAGIRENYNQGPAGDALISTPISVGNGCWDVKRVLGEADVREDGSAYFRVPARTPIYFQALDGAGRAVQSMRSWTTLQPGETGACVGCHEGKNSAPVSRGPTLALRRGAQALTPFYGPPRGFSFAREVQPMLDRLCVRCHTNRETVLASARGRSGAAPFSLRGNGFEEEKAGRRWSEAYLALTHADIPTSGVAASFLLGDPDGPWVKWIHAQSSPPMLEPCATGAARSPLLDLLRAGHHGCELTRGEWDKLACWIDLAVPFCGDYEEANLWSEAETEKYRHFLAKRRQAEEQVR